MAELLRMPEVATATTEAVLSAWPLAEGAPFSKGDTLVVVETDKAEVDIPAESDGVLLKALVPAGTQVAVGSPIALLTSAEESVHDIDSVLAQLGVSADGPLKAVVRREVPDGPVEPEHADRASRATVSERTRVFASPLARKLAREADLDIATVQGTGPGQRITRDDVRAAISARTAPPVLADSEVVREAAPGRVQAPAAGSQTAPGSYVDIPHTRMRQTIAARLLESKRMAPHFYMRATCNVEALLRIRKEINESGIAKISVNDLIIKAVAQAHAAVPEMNAVWTSDAVRRFTGIDISVAIATEGGLVTPVLRGVEHLSVCSISTQVRAFAEQARTGSLRQEDLFGGTITISNLGMYGVEEFSAIINPPQTSILAVGAAREEPTVVDGALEIARMLRLSLSVDHRPVDGALAARWMAALKSAIECPLQILV